jgi:hypothetical protein
MEVATLIAPTTTTPCAGSGKLVLEGDAVEKTSFVICAILARRVLQDTSKVYEYRTLAALVTEIDLFAGREYESALVVAFRKPFEPLGVWTFCPEYEITPGPTITSAWFRAEDEVLKALHGFGADVCYQHSLW